MRLLISMVYVLSGVITIALTHYRPPAYWNSRSRRFWRQLVGDCPTIIGHKLVGLLLLWVGFMMNAKAWVE